MMEQARGRTGRRVSVALAAAVAVVALSVLVRGSGSVAASSTSAAGAKAASIAVTGTASTTLAEDQASFTVTVQEQGATAAEALSQDDQVMEAVLSALQARGAQMSDLVTQGLSVYPVYGKEGASAPPTAFRAADTVQVHVPQLSVLGAWLDAAVQAGATDIGGVTLSASNTQAVENQVLASAVANARSKAEALAAAAGLTLGPATVINAQTFVPSPQPVIFAAASTANTPIEPGTQTVSATVQVTFAAYPSTAS